MKGVKNPSCSVRAVGMKITLSGGFRSRRLQGRNNDFFIGGLIMKTLELTFATAGTNTITVTLDNPKDDLTLETVRTKAPDIANIMVNRSGVQATNLLKAEVVSTTREELA